jgi:hypothetical protein
MVAFFMSSPDLELLYKASLEKIMAVFQNNIYMGELRQRWLEIKKLLNPPALAKI